MMFLNYTMVSYGPLAVAVKDDKQRQVPRSIGALRTSVIKVHKGANQENEYREILKELQLSESCQSSSKTILISNPHAKDVSLNFYVQLLITIFI